MTAARASDIWNAYLSGLPLAAIMARYRISAATLYRLPERFPDLPDGGFRRGMKGRPRRDGTPVSDALRAMIAADYADRPDLSLSRIAAMHGVSAEGARRIVRRLGLPFRSPETAPSFMKLTDDHRLLIDRKLRAGADPEILADEFSTSLSAIRSCPIWVRGGGHG